MTRKSISEEFVHGLIKQATQGVVSDECPAEVVENIYKKYEELPNCRCEELEANEQVLNDHQCQLMDELAELKGLCKEQQQLSEWLCDIHNTYQDNDDYEQKLARFDEIVKRIKELCDE